jgi:electron transfer flavoprotein beta subunit
MPFNRALEPTMRIIVPIKQVPETKSVKMDEKTGTVIREGVESIINPLDLYAIELAVRLKERCGATTVALTMGPPKAEEALREALAMGLDEAIFVTDRAFAGSDTWATAYVLAEAVRQSGPFDLIICGERATDGDTGQVGPEMAAYLDLPTATYVNHCREVGDGECRVGRLIEDGTEWLTLKLPALLTVVKEVSDPRLPTLRGKQRARQAPIPRLGMAELKLNPDWLGLKGSPTRVAKIFRPKVARQCEKIPAQDETQIPEAVGRLVEFLKKKNVMPGF